MAAEFNDDQILRIIQIAKTVQPMFGNVTHGSGDDNSDIIKALKDSDDKREALSKAEKQIYKEMKDKLNIKGEISDLTDVVRKQDQAAALQAVAKKIKYIQEAKISNAEEFNAHMEELGEMAKAAGTDLKSLGVTAFKPLRNATQEQIHTIKDAINLSDDLNDQAEEELKVTQEVIDKMEEMSDQYNDTKGKLDKFGGAVKQLGKRFWELGEQEQRFAQATATADAGWIDGMYKMGISQLDYMKILKDTRQEGLAAASAGVDFKASLEASADSLHGLTANYTEAAMGAKFFHQNMARIGVSQDQLGDAVASQTKMYKENYRALGYTVEEFANLTNELINDQGMRSTLLNLQESERKGYILSIQQRQAEYLTMGYTIERAKELQKTFQALNKMNPKERMKQAAKTRAMMGAMGMGAEGAELFELQTKYRTMNAKDRARAEKRMAEISAQGAKKFGSMSGSGASMGQAMVMQQMADATGFTQIADTFETETGQGLKLDKKQLETTNEIWEVTKGILGAVDMWGAASNSALGSIATGIISMVGNFLMLKGAMGFLGGMSKPGGGFFKGLAGAVTGAISAVTGPIGKVGGSMMSGAAKVGGAAINGVKGAGSLAKAAVVGISKGAGKAALKAIPGIGLIAALGLMGSRLADGDVVGAGMELASGAMGLIPGIGTAGSIGMSGAIVARDMAKATNQAGEMIEPTEETTTSKAKSQEVVLMELSTTLKTLNEYLLAGTEASGDQVKAIDKQTNTLKENQRFFAVPDGRTPA